MLTQHFYHGLHGQHLANRRIRQLAGRAQASYIAGATIVYGWVEAHNLQVRILSKRRLLRDTAITAPMDITVDTVAAPGYPLHRFYAVANPTTVCWAVIALPGQSDPIYAVGGGGMQTGPPMCQEKRLGCA